MIKSLTLYPDEKNGKMSAQARRSTKRNLVFGDEERSLCFNITTGSLPPPPLPSRFQYYKSNIINETRHILRSPYTAPCRPVKTERAVRFPV